MYFCYAAKMHDARIVKEYCILLHFFVSRHYNLHEAVQMILEDDDVLQADVFIFLHQMTD